MPEGLRGIHVLTREECSRLIAKYWRMNCDDAAKLLAEPAKLSMADAAIMRVFQEAITKGDFMRLSFLLDRAIGKVTEMVIDSESPLATMNDDELIEHVKGILKKRETAVA